VRKRRKLTKQEKLKQEQLERAKLAQAQRHGPAGFAYKIRCLLLCALLGVAANAEGLKVRYQAGNFPVKPGTRGMLILKEKEGLAFARDKAVLFTIPYGTVQRLEYYTAQQNYWFLYTAYRAESHYLVIFFQLPGEAEQVCIFSTNQSILTTMKILEARTGKHWNRALQQP
jgi:hypothetical protein